MLPARAAAPTAAPGRFQCLEGRTIVSPATALAFDGMRASERARSPRPVSRPAQSDSGLDRRDPAIACASAAMDCKEVLLAETSHYRYPRFPSDARGTDDPARHRNGEIVIGPPRRWPRVRRPPGAFEAVAIRAVSRTHAVPSSHPSRGRPRVLDSVGVFERSSSSTASTRRGSCCACIRAERASAACSRASSPRSRSRRATSFHGRISILCSALWKRRSPCK
jgi:hypothetical protein